MASIRRYGKTGTVLYINRNDVYTEYIPLSEYIHRKESPNININVAIGYQAGFNITTGSQNIAIGKKGV